MRLPRVSHEGKDYEITRYKKTIEQKKVDGRMEEWGDDVLTLSWGEYRLVCSLREIKDIIR